MVTTETTPSYLVLERQYRKIDAETMINLNPIESFDKKEDADDWIKKSMRLYEELHNQKPKDDHWIIITIGHTRRTAD